MILWFVSIVVGIIFIAIGVAIGSGLGLIFGLLGGIVTAAISAVYFVYGVDADARLARPEVPEPRDRQRGDGSTLTQDQAIRRWLFLYGPLRPRRRSSRSSGCSLALVAIGYALYLLYTTSQSPKRQGFHDVQANTVVIKRAAA